MIVMVRLDERMIHGQVAIKWARHTSVDRIIVANDEAAANEIIQKSLMMAAPQTCKTAIKSVADSIALLKDPRCDSLKILVIVSGLQDLLTLVNEITDIPLINIGNYGRIAPKHADKIRKGYGINLYAYEEEVAIFKQILDKGFNCIYQTTPEDTPIPLKNALNL